ncbi:hypothetical protein F5Y03DRAFT_358723 [Xylaria venustula]|nr:hypothetical protein F5Y03DRAFT_358723 [Xylaria venustula]
MADIPAERLTSQVGTEPASHGTRTLSPVPNTSTTTNGAIEHSEHSEYWELDNVPFSSSHTALGEAIKTSRKRKVESVEIPAEKRSKTATNSGHSTNAKQLPITLSQAPKSFCTLKVTKPMSKPQRLVSSEGKAVISLLSRTGRVPQYQRDAPVQISATTIERLTPHPIGFSSSTLASCNSEIASLEIASAIHNSDTGDESSDSSDSYPLDEDIADDDIIQLLALTPKPIKETHIPPSSVQAWDHGSQSAAEYDPTLKCSPPDPQETSSNSTEIEQVPETWKTNASEDLLDEDVDWNVVLADTNELQKPPSGDCCLDIDVVQAVNMTVYAKKLVNVRNCLGQAQPLTAFSRPPFPEKVRDRPSVSGMSSDTLLRTCFRIGAVISQTAFCFNHQQNVVFELYARVTYSSRETLSRKQHFQFVDLFKDQQPYPAATLTNWRIDSQLDKDSSAFLNTQSGPRLCWCMCKPMRDSKAAIGWTYTVLKIKEISWEQVRWAKRIICADSEEAAPGATADGAATNTAS